jgi:flavin-dependent dehydrogenase
LEKVVIIGGGIGGLVLANQLAARDISCLLIEKKEYPFHRVCGEYISNEVAPFLRSQGLFPVEFDPPKIDRLQLTSVNGKSSQISLDMGGFGISRYSFDHFLYKKAKAAGVNFLLNTEVEGVEFADNKFKVRTLHQSIESEIVVGAFGKRSKLDVSLSREFVKKRSPYVGVKYHIRTQHPNHLIALHNFQDGYCGISNIEDGKSCLCYLSHRKNFKKYGEIKSVEENILFRNPFLKKLFSESEFLFPRPEVINEISFEEKNAVENHILMLGDSAGMITPLCGNGMAIAIHSAKILREQIELFLKEKLSRDDLEKKYSSEWKKKFASRLWAGRQIQRLFGSEITSNFAVHLANSAKPIAHFLVSKTHGSAF